MLSRRRARIALLQILYSDLFLKETDEAIFRDSYQDENNLETFDIEYTQIMRKNIHENAEKLTAIIAQLSPKFDFDTIPKIHILILCIALAEIHFSQYALSQKISVNEAIELSKQFSDQSGAKFITAALSTFVNSPEIFLQNTSKSYSLFQ